MTQAVDHLWNVAGTSPHVDADTLAAAVESAAQDESLDYRSRLLVRDSLAALESHWGKSKLRDWLDRSPFRKQILQSIDPINFDDDPNEIGFPSLKRRVVDALQPKTLDLFLRELSQHISRPTRMVIGGSVPLILIEFLIRKTEDVDVVDEIPAELRTQHELLDRLSDFYKLRLAHFQSHYLPSGWETRIRSYGMFDKLQVFLIDPYDIFVGKLFSSRIKDRADLNALVSKLDRPTIEHRVRDTTAALRSDSKFLAAAEKNWYVLFGEVLP